MLPSLTPVLESLAMPDPIKIGAKVVRHGRCVTSQMGGGGGRQSGVEKLGHLEAIVVMAQRDVDTALRPGSSIRHADVDGLQVILDLETESYHALDEMASAMWAAVTEMADRDDACAELASCFAVEPARLRVDLDRFVTACVERGFLQVAAPAIAQDGERVRSAVARLGPSLLGNKAPNVVLIVRALHSIVSTRIELKRDGFRAVYERCSRLPQARRVHSLEQTCAGFLKAENFYISNRAPDDCLLRSFALLRFLRRSGLPAEHVIGVRRIPFAVHAWVECDGKAVLDDSQIRPGMTPLARLIPPG